MDGVGITSLLVAAIRAEETLRADRLFEDPFAAALAGDDGRAVLAAYRAAAGPGVPIIEVRTRYLDEALARAADDGVRQFVILAAGMDARAYRLAWPARARVFELDQPAVLARKESILATVTPRCERVSCAVDLRGEWSRALARAGFDRGARTAWLIEGLLQYLAPDAVRSLVACVAELSAPRSTALYDLPTRALLEAPVLRGAIDFMSGLSAPWLFGSDDPALFGAHGWQTTRTEAGALGASWSRWPFTPPPPHVPGVPRTHLVTAVKL